MMNHAHEVYADETCARIRESVRDAYGLTFWEDQTGGGCMALVTRLETGHWLVATDEGLCSLRERVKYEMPDEYGEQRALGWQVGIYPPSEYWGTDPNTGDTADVLVWADDTSALGDELVRLVGQAIGALADQLGSARPSSN